MCLICYLTFIAHTSVRCFKTVYVAVMQGGASQTNSDAEMEKVLAGCLVTSRGCNGAKCQGVIRMKQLQLQIWMENMLLTRLLSPDAAT